MAANKSPKKKGSFQSVSTTAFKALIAKSKVQLLDVRTLKEFNLHKIEGALLIDYYKAYFDELVDAQLDVAIDVAIYCRSGVRSVDAGLILKEKGFTVYNLKEGIISW